MTRWRGKPPLTLAEQGSMGADWQLSAQLLRSESAKSHAEKLFAFQMTSIGLTDFVPQYRFCPRKWTVDFAFVREKLAIEIQGFGPGGYGGRHQTPDGLEAQYEKTSALAIYGWRLLEASTGQVKDGSLLKWLEAALGRRPVHPLNPLDPAS